MYSIGSIVIMYAVLFGIGIDRFNNKFPIFAWWAVSIILMVASIRCWSHYLYLRRLSIYIKKLESEFLHENDQLPGFENFNDRSVIGPLVFIGANIMILAALIGLTVFFAVVKTIGYQLS